MNKSFAIIGAAGYIAPRHMQAIQDVGGKLVAALDPHDSVGILDSFAPECLYFREPERFDRWLSKNPVDYVVVCSPNYLHDSHALMAMRNGCDVICEKPLVCNERNLDNLAEWEVKTGQRVNAVLQCRYHPDVLKKKNRYISNENGLPRGLYYSVNIEYVTPRGQWYFYSWKGDETKSGGLETNIGIHLFDLCFWLFGGLRSFSGAVDLKTTKTGYLQLDRAQINWHLSVVGKKVRKFKINDFEIDLTSGFEDLHTKSYQEILAGRGFGIEDARPAIRIVEAIRNACD